MKRANVAIVGCGNISGIYLENLTGRFRNVAHTNFQEHCQWLA